MRIHTLKSGATVLVTSPGHGFKFSDGSIAEPQEKSLCDLLTLKRVSTKRGEVKGMALNETLLQIDHLQQELLKGLCQQADIVLLPFPILAALREQGIRDQFPNAVAFNATVETQRSAPIDKIVDLDNWSY